MQVAATATMAMSDRHLEIVTAGHIVEFVSCPEGYFSPCTVPRQRAGVPDSPRSACEEERIPAGGGLLVA